MKVTAKEVRHIANLSRLTVPDSEMEKFTEQFNQILNYADILQELDTNGIVPTPYVLPISNVLREDIAVEGVSHEDALLNAPEVHNGGFKVPRVIE
ncbi:Aspartyl/glutamyl-tRNA(Asn/Gln) amidotransferase subunit C [bioreactor metagenome]|uniref:Aspartyl/glutamyl-tRNA(Asn/Gln) amidotransferase subunit C n=1 Tax=bioreactor metagenome TaxID=1076179 RepID=A0A644W5D8_9ZZZZ|nr:Asp-tRNA(Asn)/Glu-tRNA(Gln) amidotransferase subunit GatC [Acidaminococcaceae bacterium]NLU43792.1 Asp-tRNA(Asn)/Glu-tRNA(Gln) amidotransferase subunit GatC [Acholeplasmataceae bacterium]